MTANAHLWQWNLKPHNNSADRPCIRYLHSAEIAISVKTCFGYHTRPGPAGPMETGTVVNMRYH